MWFTAFLLRLPSRVPRPVSHVSDADALNFFFSQNSFLLTAVVRALIPSPIFAPKTSVEDTIVQVRNLAVCVGLAGSSDEGFMSSWWANKFTSSGLLR